MLLITEIYTGNVYRAVLLVRYIEDTFTINIINYTILGHCFHLTPRGQCVVTGVLVKYTSFGNRALTCGASVMRGRICLARISKLCECRQGIIV